MPFSPAQNSRLVADVGGTNSRLALYDPAKGEIRARVDYINREFSEFPDVIEKWLAQLGEPAPTQCCIAIAAPPFDDIVAMVNMDWSFSSSELARRFNFNALRCINDFEANAYALPHLTANDLVTMHPGSPGASGKLATVGPGTGLGGSSFGLVDGVPVAGICEPGHMGLAPATEIELQILAKLMPQYGEVHNELILSGPGLERLYQTMGEVLGEKTEALQPAEISMRAVDGSCELCATTLNTFCGLLGSVCGDFVLAQGAYGGLYLTGGILPKIIPFLQDSTFEQRFRTKGAMADHLAEVPLHMVVCSEQGLVGAAHTPL
jgi:glucokinase